MLSSSLIARMLCFRPVHTVRYILIDCFLIYLFCWRLNQKSTCLASARLRIAYFTYFALITYFRKYIACTYLVADILYIAWGMGDGWDGMMGLRYYGCYYGVMGRMRTAVYYCHFQLLTRYLHNRSYFH